MKKRKRINLTNEAFRHSIIIGSGTFFLAVAASFFSQAIVENIRSLILAFVLLSMIILLGILFDIIGVAAAAADEAPLNSRASNKVSGAKQAVRLVKNADQVSSFCNDVIGDVSGTLSGAIGAAIVFRLLSRPSESEILFAGTVMTALIAALTVGGKAFGKTFAIRNATEIIFKVGQILAQIERYLHISFLGNGSKKKGRRR